MKKRSALFLMALVLCIVSAFALTACFENVESEGSWDFTADTKADSLQLLNEFFEDTLKDPNFVVTLKSGDEIQLVENVKGTSSCFAAKDGTEIYAYIDDGVYYYVCKSKIETEGGEKTDFMYCCSDETDERGYSEDAEIYYKNSYCNFMGYINIVELIPDDGGTFTCKNHGEEKNGDSTATLTFDFVAKTGTVKITANAKNDKIEKVTVVQEDKTNAEQSRTYTMTFEYGSAKFEQPDIAAYIREQEEHDAKINANYQAIDERDDFFFLYTNDENMVVTFTNGNDVIFVETIANGIDRVVFETFTVYTYVKEVDEENFDAYYVYDGGQGSRYFEKNNDEKFDMNNCAYMNFPLFGIKAFDERLVTDESATFTCETEGDRMVFTITNNGVTVTTTAIKENDLIKTVSITNGSNVYVYTFEYGKATLTEPDLTDFEDQTVEVSDED